MAWECEFPWSDGFGSEFALASEEPIISTLWKRFLFLALAISQFPFLESSEIIGQKEELRNNVPVASLLANTIIKYEIILATWTVTLSWTSACFAEAVALSGKQEEVPHTPRLVVETFIEGWSQFQLNCVSFVRNYEVHIDYFFSPVGSLICTRVYSAELHTLIPLEVLSESQGGINKNSELLVIPWIDLPKLEFYQQLIMRR